MPASGLEPRAIRSLNDSLPVSSGAVPKDAQAGTGLDAGRTPDGSGHVPTGSVQADSVSQSLTNSDSEDDLGLLALLALLGSESDPLAMVQLVGSNAGTDRTPATIGSFEVVGVPLPRYKPCPKGPYVRWLSTQSNRTGAALKRSSKLSSGLSDRDVEVSDARRRRLFEDAAGSSEFPRASLLDVAVREALGEPTGPQTSSALGPMSFSSGYDS